MINEKSNKEISLEHNVVSRTTFHRLLVQLDRWSGLPGWLIFTLLTLLLFLNFSLWLAINHTLFTSGMATAILAVFIATDAILFFLLPRYAISFGSWKYQLITLFIPRAGLSITAAVLGTVVIPPIALGLLIGLELTLSLILLWGTIIETKRLSLVEISVNTSHQRTSDQAVRILQISDLHMERWTKRETHLLELIRTAKPDIIVLTGDYLNLSYVRDSKAQEDVKSLLRQIKAPGGVYAVLGGPTVDDRAVVPSLFDGLPIRLLVNEWLEIKLSSGQKLILLGLDCSQDLDVDGDNLRRMVRNSPNHVPRILLYHTPDLMPMAADHNIDLYLTGHTHGGQIRLPFYGALLTSSQFGKRYEMGRYQEGNTILYVSRGVGLEGLGAPRIRFLSPPEITLFKLMGRRDEE